MVRLNQHGYLREDAKIAVIASAESLYNQMFQVIDSRGRIAFEGFLSNDKGVYLTKAHHYFADFSELKKNGDYFLRIDSVGSPEFTIRDNLYRNLPDSLLRYFAIQRCGRTSPSMHMPCHLKDAVSIKSPEGTTEGIDLTGGWHDAGDYIKFTLTTAYSTHLLLLTYQLFPHLFRRILSFGLPDPVAEAKIGLDWLMKAHPSPDKLISQVQDLSDHNVGWRLPEDDPLSGNRPGYLYSSKAIAGSAAAALALGSDVFARLGDRKYADKCREHAVQIFELIQSGKLPDTDDRPGSHYSDGDPRDNICLAAIELYRITGDVQYLVQSKSLIDTLGAGGWISWGDVQGIAAFRLTEYYPAAREYIGLALMEYRNNGGKNPYDYPFDIYPWGSLSLQTGVGNLAVLYEISGGGSEFRTLAVRQRDAIFGANHFGVSYFSGVGEVSSRHFHHQVARLNKIVLPGGLAEGPISRKAFIDAGIRLELPDQYADYQSDKAVYHDDPNDYLSNEPTIGGAAQAFLLLSWFASEAKYGK